ncbi:MAG: hypothetical protein J4F32_00135 [Dehalococcoidia bacterium]|nr:hypothetical protein [Dehalococcoidia bacterium]
MTIRKTPYVDPTEISVDYYKVLAWQQARRMLEWRLPAGKSDRRHSHPNALVYFVKGAKLQFSYDDGEMAEEEYADGAVAAWGDVTHKVRNVGETDLHAIVFELMTIRSSAGG